jgi:hypothetical protein
LKAERYASARVLFCGGSVVRGQGFASSDLDVVVMFDSLTAARRESFYFDGWPVEAFTHDPATLVHFVRSDLLQGRPTLAHMIADAIVVPTATAWSDRIQAWTRAILETPPIRTIEALDSERYAITDLLNDFRDDRPRAELIAVASALYPLVFNFVLGCRQSWLGWSKTLPILVQAAAPDLAQAIEAGFEAFFRADHRRGLVRAVQLVLAPFGGELFDGFQSVAPSTDRAASQDTAWLIEDEQRPSSAR